LPFKTFLLEIPGTTDLLLNCLLILPKERVARGEAPRLPGSLALRAPAALHSPGPGSSASLPRPLRSSPLLPAVFHVTILGRYSVSIPFLNFSPDGTGLFSKYYATEARYLQKDKVPRNSEVCVHTSLRSLMLQGPTQHQLPKPYSSLNTLLTCPSAHCPPTLHSKPHRPLLCSCSSHSTSPRVFHHSVTNGSQVPPASRARAWEPGET